MIQKEVTELQDFNDKNMQDAMDRSETVTKLQKVQSSREKLLDYQSSFKTEIRSVVKQSKFFEDNVALCPTCDQDIDDDLRKSKMAESKTRAKELEKVMTESNDKMSEFETQLTELNKELEEVRNLQNEVNNNNQTITRLNRNVQRIQTEIDGLAENNSDLAEANDQLEDFSKDLESKQDTKYKLHENFSYNQVSARTIKGCRYQV